MRPRRSSCTKNPLPEAVLPTSTRGRLWLVLFVGIFLGTDASPVYAAWSGLLRQVLLSATGGPACFEGSRCRHAASSVLE